MNECAFVPDPGSKVVCKLCKAHISEHPKQTYYKYPEYKRMPSLSEKTKTMAEEQELPLRFVAERLDNYKVRILDSHTGRSVVIGLHVYRDVRRVLAELFK